MPDLFWVFVLAKRCQHAHTTTRTHATPWTLFNCSFHACEDKQMPKIRYKLEQQHTDAPRILWKRGASYIPRLKKALHVCKMRVPLRGTKLSRARKSERNKNETRSRGVGRRPENQYTSAPGRKGSAYGRIPVDQCLKKAMDDSINVRRCSAHKSAFSWCNAMLYFRATSFRRCFAC